MQALWAGFSSKSVLQVQVVPESVAFSGQVFGVAEI
jgi:hypothetical protein